MTKLLPQHHASPIELPQLVTWVQASLPFLDAGLARSASVGTMFRDAVQRNVAWTCELQRTPALTSGASAPDHEHPRTQRGGDSRCRAGHPPGVRDGPRSLHLPRSACADHTGVHRARAPAHLHTGS